LQPMPLEHRKDIFMCVPNIHLQLNDFKLQLLRQSKCSLLEIILWDLILVSIYILTEVLVRLSAEKEAP